MRELTYTNSRNCMLPKDYTKSSKFFERNYAIITSVFASIGALCIGTCIGWSSTAIHLLSSDRFPLTLGNLTTRHVSWIVSGFSLGATLSPLLVYKVWRFAGSKLLILTGCGLLMTSWFLLSIYQDLLLMLCARLLAGVATGFLQLLIPLYMQEFASRELRGTLDYIWHTFLAAGIALESVAVLLKNYQLINILSCLAPALLFISFLFMPESPRYFCYKRKSNAAKEMLRKFREISDEVDLDIHSWCNYKTENFAFKNTVKYPSSFRRVFPVLGLIIFDQLSGVLGCFFYSSWNFRILGGDFTEDMSALIIAGVFFISAFLPKLQGLNCSDKATLIWTSLLQAGAALTLGLYLHYKGSYNEIEEYNYLPIICFGVYVLLYGIGINRICWKYVRYLVPRSRYFVTRAVCTSLSWAVLTIQTRGYPGVIEFVGIGWLFCFMALSCFGIAIFTIIFVPNLNKLDAAFQLDDDYIVPDVEHDSQ